MPLVYAGAFSSYDFTFYQTADKSMMEFSKNAVGIDYTGYGFIGTSSMKGLYIRLGIQTPYDNLINALLELKAQALKRTSLDTAATEEEMEMSQEVVSSVESVLSQSGFNTSPLNLGSRFETPGTTQPTIIQPTPSEREPQPEIEEPSSQQPNQDESLMDIDDAEEPIDPDLDPQDTPIQKEMDINWTLSFTIGPAYRSFMGDNALVYMGIGLTNTIHIDYHFDDKVEQSLTSLSNTIGADIDFGIRFDVEKRTTLRIGTHVTTDLIGWNSVQQKDKDNEVLSGTFNFYGYAFAGDSIFTNMENVWYVRLATTFKQQKLEVYDYINPSPLLGGGYLVPHK